MGLALMSMTVRAVLWERPESEVRRLCEMWSSWREVRDSRPLMERRRLDWMLRILRFARASRPFISVILFLPSQSSSSPVRESRPWMSRMRLAPSSIWRSWVSPSRFSIVEILFWTK